MVWSCISDNVKWNKWNQVLHILFQQVVELGQMQDILSENVDLQAHQIEEIQETIMAATENVREGNEQVS